MRPLSSPKKSHQSRIESDTVGYDILFSYDSFVEESRVVR
ncbi:MAG: hypothetical protein [Olavius algarvensis Gamma 1 endosymbiont]|nr:MAG: hypothetical protein [Olavius algarvensis Gamma 1 endosymbiont]